MASFPRSDLTGRSGMPQKSSARPGLISASAGGNPKVVMVQEAEPSEAPASIPKVSPNEQYGQYKCPSCGRQFVSKAHYKKHVKNPCEGKYRCSSCGKQYSFKPCYERHLKYLCKGPFTCSTCGKLYRYRHLRKGCGDVVGGVSGSGTVPTSFHRTEETRSGEAARELSLNSGHLPSSLSRHLDTRLELGVGPCTGGPDPAPQVQECAVDSIPTDQLVYCCSVPYCGQSFVDQGSLLHHQGEHLRSGPEYGGSRKRKRVLGDRAVCGTLGGDTSSESREAHTDYLSVLQISNVMSLGSAQDQFLRVTEELATSTGKEREPEEGNPSSGSRGKDVAPHADKPGWQSWAQKCLHNRTRARQKWLNSGGRRAVCLLCGRRFRGNAALDHHAVSAHCERMQYRCGSCSVSFRAWTCLCRHVLQAHSVKIQRNSRTSPIAEAKKCILKAKNKDIAEAKFISNEKDASIDNGSQGRLINDDQRANSKMKNILMGGLLHLCLFAVKDIQKGEKIVFDHGGVDHPWRTSTQTEKTHILQHGLEVANNESKRTYTVRDGLETIKNEDAGQTSPDERASSGEECSRGFDVFHNLEKDEEISVLSLGQTCPTVQLPKTAEIEQSNLTCKQDASLGKTSENLLQIKDETVIVHDVDESPSKKSSKSLSQVTQVSTSHEYSQFCNLERENNIPVLSVGQKCPTVQLHKTAEIEQSHLTCKQDASLGKTSENLLQIKDETVIVHDVDESPSNRSSQSLSPVTHVSSADECSQDSDAFCNLEMEENFVLSLSQKCPTVQLPKTAEMEQSHLTCKQDASLGKTSENLLQIKDQTEIAHGAHKSPSKPSSKILSQVTHEKKNFCFVCGKPQLKLARHFKVHEKMNAEIAQVLSLKPASNKRKQLLEQLRNRGNFIHNNKVLAAGTGSLKVKRRPKEGKSLTYQCCLYCKGQYKRSELWRHMKRCPSRKGNHKEHGRKQVLGLADFAQFSQVKYIDEGVMEMLSEMISNEITAVVKDEPCIIQLAQTMFHKVGHDKTKHSFIIRRLRDLGRLLLASRKIGKSIHSIEDAVKPANFPDLLDVVKEAARFNASLNRFENPNLALRIGFALKKVANNMLYQSIIGGDDSQMKSVQCFLDLHSKQWPVIMAHLARSGASELKYNKPTLLPLSDDVKKLAKLLEKTADAAFKTLETSNAVKGYSDLCKATLSQVILFNRRRAGEVSCLKLQHFHNGDQSLALPEESVSPQEQKLARCFSRIELPGKRGREVSILLTPTTMKALVLLIQKRKDCGVPEDNVYLFAIPHGLTFYSGAGCLRNFANHCGAQFPKALRSALLRKHMATSLQILNLKDNELDMLADFLGHDVWTFESKVQKKQISKLLVAMQTGRIIELRGKSLRDIEDFQDSDWHSESEDDDIKRVSHSPDLPNSSEDHGPDLENESVTTPMRRRPVRRPWSKAELSAVMRHFKGHIIKGHLARVKECESCLKAEAPILNTRTTWNIRDFVRNRGVSYRKRRLMTK
ncbi:hypothetical protein SKAU_G00005510 [Synaphobranchus kaupii]|uniref:C2H2-type domain-containing protein n=1 Tax=Synaphobranchus kaupii TaxID=118154 RepID=A0A9Q1GA40_SYNKA|nr:hypothetical protein SKAU_G00005510 [Synaphobranchus kaupii]